MIGAALKSGTLARAACLVTVLALAGCSGFMSGSDVSVTRTGSDSGRSTAVPAGTDPEDKVIGRREHPRIISAYGGVYSDRQAEIMVARIAGRLLTAADQGDESYTVTILDTADVNAFALPGGYIYVTRGILALANDASELAAVMAHEIAHVTLRHARARSERSRTTEIVDRVITNVLGGNAKTDQSAARSRLSLAAFNQRQELEADEEGVKIAGRAGYDPHAAARFLEAMGRFASLSRNGTSSGDDFLSSHPSTPERIQQAVESARAFGEEGTGKTDREAYLEAIDGLRFGDSPAHGAIIGRKFVHPSLGFTFTVPRGYTLKNTQPAVVAVAGDGEAVRFDTAEVPGSMELPEYLRSGWIAGLKPDTITEHSYNGIPMASGEAETDEWIFRVAVLRFDGEVYRFIFAARADSSGFADAAEATLKSFHQATDADIAEIKKASIDIVTAHQGDTLSSLAERMGPVANAGELFLVLNNLYLGDPVEVGRAYKIVTVE